MLKFTRNFSLKKFPLFQFNIRFFADQEPKKIVYKGNHKAANAVLNKKEPFSKAIFDEYLKHVPKPKNGKAKLNRKIFTKAVTE